MPAAIKSDLLPIAQQQPLIIGSQNDVSGTLPQTRLYLALASGEGAEARLKSALAVADFDAVMIAPPPGSTYDDGPLRTLVSLAQRRNAAALIEGDAALAKSVRADGVHLAWSDELEDQYETARKLLGPREIIGVDATGSRHVAMALAEAGADYIALSSATAEVASEDAIPGQAGTQAELVAWWAEVFEVPCVALDVRSAEQAVALAAAGAEFVGVMAEAGLSGDAVADRVKAIADALNLRFSPARGAQ